VGETAGSIIEDAHHKKTEIAVHLSKGRFPLIDRLKKSQCRPLTMHKRMDVVVEKSF
jgi:hypothetical protein